MDHNRKRKMALKKTGYIESITPSQCLSCSPGIFISYFLLAGRVPEDTADRP
jgi:hypothetical protein